MAVPSDQDILDGLKTALYQITVNGCDSYSINGRSWKALDLDKLEEAIGVYERRVARSSAPMMGVITFRSPR